MLHALSWLFFWEKFCSFLRYRPQGPASTTSCVSKTFCEGSTSSRCISLLLAIRPAQTGHLPLQGVFLGGIALQMLPSDLSLLSPHRAYRSHGGGRMLSSASLGPHSSYSASGAASPPCFSPRDGLGVTTPLGGGGLPVFQICPLEALHWMRGRGQQSPSSLCSQPTVSSKLSLHGLCKSSEDLVFLGVVLSCIS